MIELSKFDRDILKCAGRNHGRTFVTALADEPFNVAINRMTDGGLFVDGGPSTSGRWRVLTAAGRAALEQGDA